MTGWRRLAFKQQSGTCFPKGGVAASSQETAGGRPGACHVRHSGDGGTQKSYKTHEWTKALLRFLLPKKCFLKWNDE